MDEDRMKDPFGEYTAGAVAMHEMYQAYLDAGFTREEAMQIILCLLMKATAG